MVKPDLVLLCTVLELGHFVVWAILSQIFNLPLLLSSVVFTAPARGNVTK